MPILTQLVAYLGGVGTALSNGLATTINTAGAAIVEVGKALLQITVGS